jgi:hypothetical protein
VVGNPREWSSILYGFNANGGKTAPGRPAELSITDLKKLINQYPRKNFIGNAVIGVSWWRRGKSLLVESIPTTLPGKTLDFNNWTVGTVPETQGTHLPTVSPTGKCP